MSLIAYFFGSRLGHYVIAVLFAWILLFVIGYFFYGPTPVRPALHVFPGFLLGIPVLVETFTRFALQGGGTPAPVAPTQHLVITGPNRYVRNPIYLALVAIVLGQGLILGNARLLVYGALLWIGFHIFVLAYEEPTLRRRFGAEYDTYCANVSRWLPRLPGSTSASS